MVNGSNCPQFCDGEIRAFGVSIIIKKDDKYYALLMKDKSKKILTCVGGTCNQKDFKNDKNFGISTALREVFEETGGNVEVSSDTIIHYDGLKLSKNDIQLISETKLESVYYGLKVDDFYTCYGVCVNVESDVFFKNLLFHPNHQQVDGNYKLNYVNHNETEYIYAVQLQEVKTFNLENTMNLVHQNISTCKIDCRISSLNMLFNYAILCSPFQDIEVEDEELFKKVKLPPMVKRLKLYK
jgi:hypothetical protein